LSLWASGVKQTLAYTYTICWQTCNNIEFSERSFNISWWICSLKESFTWVYWLYYGSIFILFIHTILFRFMIGNILCTNWSMDCHCEKNNCRIISPTTRQHFCLDKRRKRESSDHRFYCIKSQITNHLPVNSSLPECS
jgi:hypothetical protein